MLLLVLVDRPVGVGMTVSYPSPLVWSTKFPYTNSCASRTPQTGSGGGSGGGCCVPGDGACSNAVGAEPECDSPIIIDTLGIGFYLSDPETECVLFKMVDGIKCLSWPTVGSGNGFLALPDAKGEVTSVLQLYGNQTPVPKRKPMFPGGPVPKIPNPHNGFDVLQGYTYGLTLNASATVWSKLRIWIPEHCFNNPNQVCIGLPSEMHLLSEFGIYNIGLIYSTSNKIDQYGNDYRYISHYNVSPSNEGKSEYGLAKEDRTIYDVYLRVNTKK